MSRIDEILEKLPGLAEKLRQELSAIAAHPRSLAARLETQSPWLSRQFLGAASNFVEPFLVAMGLSIASFDEDLVAVILPGHWRNQGEGGEIHNSALTALGEFASRLYWEHHLGLRGPELRARVVTLRLLSRATGDLRGVFRWTVAQREEIQLRLRAAGQAEASALVSIYDASERLVAEVDIEWLLSRQLALK